MHSQAKQENVPTPAGLAGQPYRLPWRLDRYEGASLRRQVVMLINHSYALGYVTGAGVGLVARMQSRIALARRGTCRVSNCAVQYRERMTMIIPITDAVPIGCWRQSSSSSTDTRPR